MARSVPTSAVIGDFKPPPENALKKQSRYGSDNWKPGEIPTRNGTLISVITPDGQAEQPYGEFMAVQKPKGRGKGWPK